MSQIIKFGHVSHEEYPKIVNEFAANLMQDKFIGNQCTTCGKKYFPPVTGCEDFHKEMKDYEIKTDAVLKAFTVIHFAPENMSDKAPYIVAIGELEDGLSVLAHLVGVTAMPKIGMKMRLKSQKLADDRVVYKFVPV